MGATTKISAANPTPTVDSSIKPQPAPQLQATPLPRKCLDNKGVPGRPLPCRIARCDESRLIVVASLPVGVTGLALEHVFRVLFAKPVAAAAFLTLNGLIAGVASLVKFG